MLVTLGLDAATDAEVDAAEEDTGTDVVLWSAVRMENAENVENEGCRALGGTLDALG